MGGDDNQRGTVAPDVRELAMTLVEFEQHVFAVAMASPLCGIPAVRRLTPTSINYEELGPTYPCDALRTLKDSSVPLCP